jgi:hypothetical protein
MICKVNVVDGDLYQWDVERKIEIISNESFVKEVHFSNSDKDAALVVTPYEENGSIYAKIPNILLQKSVPIKLYLATTERTIKRFMLTVYARVKPDGYVYTETEILNYNKLNERLSYLEEHGGSSSGVDFKTDNTLILENGVLSVNTTNQMEKDNTLPITSAGVYATVGNIEVLLKTI